MNLSALLPGMVTLLLALFGGVGGSVLLEVWWKPRRTRRRVAALLAHEVNINGQMLVLHTHLRKQQPGVISGDFQLSQLGFNAVAQELSELPPNVASYVIVTYHRFDHLNRLCEMFSERYHRWQDAIYAAQGVEHRVQDAMSAAQDVERLKRYALTAFDSFNTNLDSTLKEARETFALLRKQAPKLPWREVSDAEYAEKVAKSEAERQERLRRLEETGP